MADDKWIDGLTGDMPLAKAAERVLAVRLGVVAERLPLALHDSTDIENVHQLRVGTRRAGAALHIFRAELPPRLARKLRRCLKRIRRAAGGARDWDVFLDMLRPRSARAASQKRRGLDFLLGYSHGQRVHAQDQLHDELAGQAERATRLRHRVGQALDGGSGNGRTLRDLAVPLLTDLIGELEHAASGDLTDYDALHQVRILGKQLRYAMEIFASCFGPEFREQMYPQIVEMQDILGLANDSHVATGRLRALQARLEAVQPKEWSAYRPAFDALLRFHQRRLLQQRRAFARWWDAWTTSGGAAMLHELVH